MRSTRKMFLRTGTILALFAVAFGALGAHALKTTLSPERLISFETATRYQLMHAIVLLVISALIHQGKKSLLVYSGWVITGGVVLFSGSIYLLVMQDLVGVDFSFAGPLTPIGGVMLMLGWGMIFLSSFQKPEAYHQSSGKRHQEAESE